MITLETAKQLKQLGFPQNTLLSYYELVNNEWEIELTENLTSISNEESFGVKELYASPIFSEIWKLLPKTLAMFDLVLDQFRIGYIIHNEWAASCFEDINENNLEESSAKLWLKLKQYDG